VHPHFARKTVQAKADYNIASYLQAIGIAGLGTLRPLLVRALCEEPAVELEFRAMPKTKAAKPTKSSGIPNPTPVRMPAGYVPKGTKPQFLSWDWVTERLEKSHNYWICTTRADGRPHAMPVWGVFVNNAVAFSTDPSSLKARNMKARPEIVVHAESGDEVVILEGKVEKIKLTTEIDDAYNTKYKMRLSTFPGGATVFQLKPRVVMSWREKDFVKSSTRWQFD
jgi:hypothetical protein